MELSGRRRCLAEDGAEDQGAGDRLLDCLRVAPFSPFTGRRCRQADEGQRQHLQLGIKSRESYCLKGGRLSLCLPGRRCPSLPCRAFLPV
ncbi:MAG: hypothetical protein EOS38_32050 [Mesorhizobium sp.]|nr:hypothetical protein EOA38_10595 [Mesorhizobium sp. M1E.F.Ca.ET.041.01.1.1]RWD79275.1 MAG: hypothetical protein EOS38_32050 [Mesorhizobium sp.]RWD82207.1 MAG: hypothetical protein EOS39_30540 [Mesorhizobium sp.]TIV48635.1 MAG: hypothetical protein E5V88_28440 [Mesorhizobium sp.]